jgi:ubiquinone/menaquinone biosynthesis C-methylase UbiE
MGKIMKIETIENRWDILYRDYPEIYDKFASFPYKPKWIDVINEIFDFKGKVVIDVGSGSGLSTFELAKNAKYVIGVEPEEAMRSLAIKNASKRKVQNVNFVEGWAEKMPLDDNSTDIVIGVTVASFHTAENIELFVKEAKRILTRGGLIISIDVAPGWYGGELAPVILGRTRRFKFGYDSEIIRNDTFTFLGFKHKDFYQIQEYGSLSNILSTYGFIFGKKAINYLTSRKKTSIKWKFRVQYFYKN